MSGPLPCHSLSGVTTPLTLRPISAQEHREFIASRSSASFLQTPAWAAVKSEWKAESIGWFRGSELVGAGLVLYRQLPKVKRYLAYLPEGPVIDWSGDDLESWLADENTRSEPSVRMNWMHPAPAIALNAFGLPR